MTDQPGQESPAPESSAAPSTPARRPRILFMGSGEIAVPTLAVLAAAVGFDLVRVVTQPDRPVGRRRVLTPTPVGQWCADHKTAVDKPGSVSDDDFVEFLQTLDLDLIVVFAFGQILKHKLLKLPRLGCVNIHASLLPKYRGAAPIAAAILHGDKATGISIMQMTTGLDAGGVYARFEVLLKGDEYSPDLEQRLGDLAAEEICPVLQQIMAGELQAEPQDDSQATYARKLQKADGLVHWSDPAAQIERQVRAYFPWPGAWFVLPRKEREWRVTITAATPRSIQADASPSTVVQADEEGLVVACGQDALRLDRLIPEGRKEMSGIDFIRGRPLSRGLQLQV